MMSAPSSTHDAKGGLGFKVGLTGMNDRGASQKTLSFSSFLLVSCWSSTPKARPTFERIIALLSSAVGDDNDS